MNCTCNAIRQAILSKHREVIGIHEMCNKLICIHCIERESVDLLCLFRLKSKMTSHKVSKVSE